MATNSRRKPKKVAIRHTRIQTSGNGAKNAQEMQKAVVITDLEQLSLQKFITCMVQGDLSVLRVSGVPTPHELFYAWIVLLSAYYTLTKSKEQLKYIKMAGKMEALNLKIQVVKALCEALRLWYDEKLVKSLQAWGYKLKYDPDNLLPDIDRTLVEVSNDEFHLLRMRTEHENEQKHKKKSKESPNKDYYMKILYAIEKHRQQRYPKDKINMYEYGMWFNELVNYAEEMRQQNEKVTDKKYRKNGSK